MWQRAGQEYCRRSLRITKVVHSEAVRRCIVCEMVSRPVLLPSSDHELRYGPRNSAIGANLGHPFALPMPAVHGAPQWRSMMIRAAAASIALGRTIIRPSNA
jgi:hypothetical protein